ncbi:hypothetical protein ACP70R_010379 [Stipagrostis hirtigluma subsp. patula]
MATPASPSPPPARLRRRGRLDPVRILVYVLAPPVNTLTRTCGGCTCDRVLLRFANVLRILYIGCLRRDQNPLHPGHRRKPQTEFADTKTTDDNIAPAPAAPPVFRQPAMTDDSRAAREDDRLSKLGDSVLGLILSFLPSFEAARAAALSRRSRNIFAAVKTVSLDQGERPIPDGDGFWPLPIEAPPFGNVVSAALLARQRRGACPLRELRVSFRDLRGLNSALVDQFLSCAMQQAGDELHLDLRLRGSVVCSLRRRRSDPENNDEPPCAATYGDHAHDEEEDEDTASPPADDDARPRAIPAPTRLFSCVALRSLRLGPCRLDLPVAAVDLPSLETLLLTGTAGEQVQRLVAACPRLADLTLEACAKLTTLSVLDKRLRRLALRCCHELTAVAADTSELRVLEYKGVVPAASFLTMHGPPGRISSCTLDFCSEEPSDSSVLRGFLELFTGAEHLHIKSTYLGSSAAGFPLFTSLRHLELTGTSPDDDTTVAAAVSMILQRTPSLETLSLFFLPEPQSHAYDLCYDDEEAILDVPQLRYDRHAALGVPDGREIHCLRQRTREINLVHYQGAVSQRMLAKFLLGNAAVVEELCCAMAQGTLWMQTRLMEEMRGWAMNKSARIIFV